MTYRSTLLVREDERTVIALPTGELSIAVHRSDFALSELCGFAARRNPKRGFLFVSKVLGKHIPVKPSLMREVHSRLAAKIPADLPGPVVLIGMAETAICLGHGVYDEYIRQTGRTDVVFIHSTRYRLDKPVALEFLEEHSHAADHIMYLPEDAYQRSLFENARSLVLVDDEASTGKTFVNLANAFKQRIPGLKTVVTAVITDWRGPTRTQETLSAMPVPSSTIAILEGEYQFTPAPNLVLVNMPKVTGDDSTKDELLGRNHGRLGLMGAYELDADVVSGVLRRLRETGDGDVLVLGTGEFAYPPFLLAEKLEAAGVDVRFQTTTRSPIMVGNAIGSVVDHTDNYADGIPNFIYNVEPGQYSRVLIVHETPGHTLDPKLVEALQAELLEI